MGLGVPRHCIAGQTRGYFVTRHAGFSMVVWVEASRLRRRVRTERCKVKGCAASETPKLQSYRRIVGAGPLGHDRNVILGAVG